MKHSDNVIRALLVALSAEMAPQRTQATTTITSMVDPLLFRGQLPKKYDQHFRKRLIFRRYFPLWLMLAEPQNVGALLVTLLDRADIFEAGS